MAKNNNNVRGSSRTVLDLFETSIEAKRINDSFYSNQKPKNKHQNLNVLL